MIGCGVHSVSLSIFSQLVLLTLFLISLSRHVLLLIFFLFFSSFTYSHSVFFALPLLPVLEVDERFKETDALLEQRENDYQMLFFLFFLFCGLERVTTYFDVSQSPFKSL